jgi:multiple sugar transport system permease protein
MPAPSTSPASTSTWASRTVVNTLLALVALYTLMPLSWLLVNATKNNGDLFGRPGFRLAEFNLFSNLADLFAYQDGIFGRWLANSMLYSVVGALASTLISLLAGYAFDKYAFRGKEKLYGLVLLGILVPHTVISLPMYLMASEIGLVNTYWAVLVPGLVNPFGVYLARVFAESYVPGETLEAARIDGAGELRTFRSVALPMLSPAFMTIFLFSFTGSWNNFFLPLVMLNDSALYPVGLGLFNWNATLAQEPQFYAFVITGSLLSIVPLAAAFVALQRYWRSGLTAGAVK